MSERNDTEDQEPQDLLHISALRQIQLTIRLEKDNPEKARQFEALCRKHKTEPVIDDDGNRVHFGADLSSINLDDFLT